MKEQYTALYRALRTIYHRYCMIDEPDYSWYDNLKALLQDEHCPIKRAAAISWLARID